MSVSGINTQKFISRINHFYIIISFTEKVCNNMFLFNMPCAVVYAQNSELKCAILMQLSVKGIISMITYLHFLNNVIVIKAI